MRDREPGEWKGRGRDARERRGKERGREEEGEEGDGRKVRIPPSVNSYLRPWEAPAHLGTCTRSS